MAWRGGWYGDWKPYVPVAKRKANAASHAAKLAKKEGRALVPVKIDGRKIVQSFWGQAWCDNLERYSDFANRLPRGRTYVRNGSVVDLCIENGRIKALVAGSDVYTVTITIDTLAKPAWKRIKQDCSQSIASLIDLLQGKFDQGVMQRLTLRDGGLFPKPGEIKMRCSCPDSAWLCKHLAAVMYGVGARLDLSPELLFTLRAVDHLELIGQAVAADNLEKSLGAGQPNALAGSNLAELFGIEIDAGAVAAVTDITPTRKGKLPKARLQKFVGPKKNVIAVSKAKTSKKPNQTTTTVKSGKAIRKRAAAKKSAAKRPTRKPTVIAATRAKGS
jgi:uncharacterized Zn finger protein